MGRREPVRKLIKVEYGFAVILTAEIPNFVRPKEEKSYDAGDIVDKSYKYKTLREIIARMRKIEKDVENYDVLDTLIAPRMPGRDIKFKVNNYIVNLDTKMQDSHYIEETYGEFSMDTLNIETIIIHS